MGKAERSQYSDTPHMDDVTGQGWEAKSDPKLKAILKAPLDERLRLTATLADTARLLCWNMTSLIPECAVF